MKVTGVPDASRIPAVDPGPALLDGSHTVIDTRSPAEFAAGHIPGAHSVPLFDDDERAVIGTLYKKEGQPAAIAQGLQAVNPKLTALIEAAQALHDGRPLLVHCWRGGMRSASVAWLFAEAGLPVQRLTGGYKAYRAWARTELAAPRPYVILGGMTGVGKTALLEALAARGEAVLDLEGLAQHMGSAFGNLNEHAQPSSEQFSNDCHATLHALERAPRIWVEDESRKVGRVHLPEVLHERLRHAPYLEILRTDSERIDHLCDVYGSADIGALKDAFTRIGPKLGRQHVQAAHQALDAGDLRTAAAIGLQYYDKLYRHTQQRYKRRQTATFDASHATPTQAAEQLALLNFV